MQDVLLCAEAYLLGVVDGVGAVQLVDALLEGGGIVAGAVLVVEHKVEAGLVEGHGFGGGEDADVAHARCRRMAVTVAVHRKVVASSSSAGTPHHVDVDDIAAWLLEVVVYSLRRGGHRLEETVLVTAAPLRGAASGGMDIDLADDGRYADALVLQHTAEAAHGVTLEEGEVDHEVVVCQMAAHDVVLDVAVVGHGQVDGVLLVHDVDRGDVVEAALRDGLTV